MRRLVKLDEPEVLKDNASVWLKEWLADRENAAKRYRYRDRSIKAVLIRETHGKCVYCESKLGVTHPGETEHKIPSSKMPELHFQWSNLTRACTECNRRKNDFFDAMDGFIDPYVDEVEALLEHHGPVVFARNGDAKANVAIRTLELNSRESLVLSKTQELVELRDSVERYWAESDPTLREVLRLELINRAHPSKPYSAMVLECLARNGVYAT